MNIENKTICLNMIVKNESKIIVRMLSSVLPLIDSYCICDTGSTDDTKDIITTFFNNHNIPGKIVSEPFRNFGYNRTFALQQCDGMPNSDYLLLMDADMILKIPETLQITQFKRSLTTDAYNIFQGTHNFMYQNVRLIKNNKNCSYWGVTHEYMKLPQGSVTANIERTQLFINDIGDGGSKSDKYIRDIKLLLQGLEDIPNNDRYTFYLANSYKDSGQYQNAIDNYKKRIELGGWIQEQYISCLRIYECYTHLKQTENALYYLVKSFLYDKERFECVYELTRYYCQNNMDDVAYVYYSIVKSFYETKYLTSSIDGKLFLDISKADFYLPYYMIIVADRVKEAETGIQMYRTIFTKKYVETNHFYTRNILFNLQFFIDKVHEDQISEFIQLFKNYIQFLLSNNYPVYDNDFMDKYVKYGIEVPAKTQKPNFSKSECSNSNKILIYTGFMTDLWNDTYLSENSLGGSEKAVAYVSRYLPKHFDIYISGDVKDEVVGNITYIHRYKLQSLLDTEKFHTIIVSRYVSFFLLYKQFSCYQLFLSAHDSTGFLNNITSNTVTTHSIINKWNDVIDGAVCLTDWHKQQIMNEHPCLANKMHTINNGIVTDSFPSIKTKTKNKFVWTSCSYRGLYTLLKMWDDILVHIPDATLSISSYETFPKNEQDNEMLQIINRHSSISHHGKLNPEQLYELLSTAEYWLYTSDFKETSCITSLEMLMSEVICLYYPLAGLTDTLGDYGIQLQCGNEISTLLNLSDEDKINIRKKGKEYAMSCSWENRALQWSVMLDMKQRLNWAFYCSPQFEKKMVQLYIDNLNNIYSEYYIFLTSDRNKIIKNIHSKVTFVYEIFDDDLISILPNVEFSYLNTEPLNLDCRLQSVKTILNNYPKMKYYDYSKSNLKILQEESIDIKNKIYLPYKCSRDELKTLIELNENTKKEYDFGIIKASGGYVNDRRQIVVDYLKQQKFTVNIIGGWGNDRDIELSKCRAILNIHGFYRVPSNIFEHIRCDRLLEAGFTVLSESSYKLDDDFIMKYPNLKIIDYADFLNSNVINSVLTIEYPVRDYRYDVCNKGQSSGLDLNKYVKNCIDIIGTSDITNICDIGCGMGEHSKLLLSQYPNLKITGIDWSQLTIKYLNNNTSFFHEIVHCKSNNLPFNNKQFSVALCMENLEHLYANDCIDAFKELKRISEYIIITIPRPEYIVNRHWLTKEISEASNDIIPLSFKEYIALESCVHKTGYYESTLMHAGFKKCHIEHPYNGIYFCKSNELDISKIQYTGIDSNDLLQTSNYKEKYIDLLHKSLNLNFIQNQPKVVDGFIFYNELDMLTYRLNILNDVVDYFVLVEATHTFVGKEKPLFYQENKHLFEKFNHKIIHIIVDDFPHKYPNIDFEKKEQWNNEKFQRNCISRGIQKINLIDNDIIILSDVDEIPNIEILQGVKCNKIHINEVKALQMDFYYYNLHSKLDHYTDVARMLPYYIYQKCNMTIDDLRFKCHKSYISNAGWHLSYFGNEKFIQNKIENFAHQELNIDLFTNQKKIQERIQNAKDLFDRPTKIIYIEIQDNDNLPPKYDIYLKPFYITNLTNSETI